MPKKQKNEPKMNKNYGWNGHISKKALNVILTPLPLVLLCKVGNEHCSDDSSHTPFSHLSSEDGRTQLSKRIFSKQGKSLNLSQGLIAKSTLKFSTYSYTSSLLRIILIFAFVQMFCFYLSTSFSFQELFFIWAFWFGQEQKSKGLKMWVN